MKLKDGARVVVGFMALSMTALMVAGTVRYSTMLETLVKNPLVSEWRGPAALRIGTSPDCDGRPCWALESWKDGSYEQVDLPKAPLQERFAKASAGASAFYRFDVKVADGLSRSDEALAFSPNWVVHRVYDLYVDGQWVGRGHGLTRSGDIVYQKVIVPLPESAKAKGEAQVTVVASVGPNDIGIQHLGKILVGPATELGRLHVEAEFAMGSYYLLFLTAEGAVFVFFAMIYLLARTRRGFGLFVAYGFLMTCHHLAIGNFLEGILPISPRIFLYFLAKGGATTLLLMILGQMLWHQSMPRIWRALSTMPAALIAFWLVDMFWGTHTATIASLHTLANMSLFASLLIYLAAAALRRAEVRLDAALFSVAYVAFLGWNFFIYPSRDFDYRSLADLAFFYFVAWLTLSEFGVAQAEVSILRRNFDRMHGIFGRLVGAKLARHLLISGSENDRETRIVTVSLFDLRFTERMLKLNGQSATLSALDQFVDKVSAAVENRGGEVQKIFGDKVIAVWGLSDAAKSDTETSVAAAVAAAIDVRESVRAWNESRRERGEPTVAFAAAVATGASHVGAIGRGGRIDYGVFGEPVGRVFSLADRAKTFGQDLVVDSETQVRLAETLVVEPVASVRDGEFFLVVGQFEGGRLRTGDPVLSERFGTLNKGGNVYEIGSRQNVFVAKIREVKDAA